VPALVAAGHSVSATVRNPARSDAVRSWGAKPVETDLFDPAAVRSAVAGHDAVCNLTTHIPSLARAVLPGAWLENNRIRRRVSGNLSDAALAADVPRLVQESIGFVYPDCADEWISKETSPQPNSVTQSAVDAEANVTRFTSAGGIGVTLRFGYFYGPSSSHSADMVRLARLGVAPSLGDPSGFMSFIHSDDIGPAVARAIDAPVGVYNICDDEPLRRAELHAVFAAALGGRRLREPGTLVARAGGSRAATMARSQRLSNAAFKKATGWEPGVPSARTGWRAVIRGTAGAI
jgi:nucleoside-diphosphate-sugar epimerase